MHHFDSRYNALSYEYPARKAAASALVCRRLCDVHGRPCGERLTAPLPLADQVLRCLARRTTARVLYRALQPALGHHVRYRNCRTHCLDPIRQPLFRLRRLTLKSSRRRAVRNRYRDDGPIKSRFSLAPYAHFRFD